MIPAPGTTFAGYRVLSECGKGAYGTVFLAQDALGKPVAIKYMSTTEAGEYELALKGDGNDLGFEDIINQFGAKGGQSVYMYAGVAKLHQGEYEESISYLKKYKGEDPILMGRTQCCIGDAYVGLEDYTTALSWYDKAAKTTDNIFAAAYLLKAGIVAEEMGNKDKALAYYKEIKDKWGVRRKKHKK